MSAAIIIAQARVERARIAAIQTAIAAVRAAQERARAKGLSEAAEFLALEALVEAEGQLIALVTDPGFAAYLGAVRDQLDEILRLSRAAESVS